MARIVITEFMEERAVALLASVHDVLYEPQLVDDVPRLTVYAADADALIVRNRTQVRGSLLAALKRCKVIGRLGVGLDNIDVTVCESRRIQVIPATGANALSVAEYVIGTALLLLRGAYQSTAFVASGEWPRNSLSNGREIAGKTLGLIGFGAIGQLTARLAQGMGMTVMTYDSMLNADHPIFAQAGVRVASLDDVTAFADVISLHIPFTPTTMRLFDAARLSRMKQGAILINTARGGIVDELALSVVLKTGHLGGAAIDVFGEEPMSPAPHFQNCPHLILTPHVAGVTAESNIRVSTLIAEHVLKALA